MAPMGGNGSYGRQHTVAPIGGSSPWLQWEAAHSGSYERQLTVAPMRSVVAPMGGSTQWLP